MFILNFGHPFSVEQLVQLRQIAGEAINVVTVPVQLDMSRPIDRQIEQILDDYVDWSADEWQVTPFFVNLPGFSAAAATVLALIHGRAGYFPPIIVMRRVEGTPPRFEVAEILDLQSLRDRARAKRFGG